MRIRWLKKLDGALELQGHVDPLVGRAGGDESYWKPVEVVTQQDEAAEAIQQEIAAKVGVTPAQVRRIEELLKNPATDGLVLPRKSSPTQPPSGEGLNVNPAFDRFG